MLKTFGILLILSAMLYLSFAFSVFERRRLLQCDGFLALLRHARAQISCFKMPLSRVWETFSCDELERCGFLKALRETSDLSQALEACEGELHLSPEMKELLVSFAGEAGRSYLHEQIACCDYYIEELERLCAQKKEKAPAQIRLWRSLFLTGGLTVILLLI